LPYVVPLEQQCLTQGCGDLRDRKSATHPEG
jgi:hypothetical protein